MSVLQEEKVILKMWLFFLLVWRCNFHSSYSWKLFNLIKCFLGWIWLEWYIIGLPPKQLFISKFRTRIHKPVKSGNSSSLRSQTHTAAHLTLSQSPHSLPTISPRQQQSCQTLAAPPNYELPKCHTSTKNYYKPPNSHCDSGLPNSLQCSSLPEQQGSCCSLV